MCKFLIPEILQKGTKEALERKYHEFSTLSFVEIEDSINDGTIQGTGVSPETCRRFRQRSRINTNAFQVFCQILNVSWEEVRESENGFIRQTQEFPRNQRLNFALRKLDHRSQWFLFKRFIDTTNNNSVVLCFQKNQAVRYGVHWLIESLIHKKNSECGYQTHRSRTQNK